MLAIIAHMAFMGRRQIRKGSLLQVVQNYWLLPASFFSLCAHDRMHLLFKKMDDARSHFGAAHHILCLLSCTFWARNRWYLLQSQNVSRHLQTQVGQAHRHPGKEAPSFAYLTSSAFTHACKLAIETWNFVIGAKTFEVHN